MTDFMISMRKKKGKQKELLHEIGPTLFLTVPKAAAVEVDHACSKKDWLSALTDSLKENGSIVCLLHSEQSSAQSALETQRCFSEHLKAQGFNGTVVGIDWVCPSGSVAEWEDRDAARDAARLLRDDCISLLCTRQQKDCSINVHIVAHGSGAFVLREAMTLADEKQAFKNSFWTVNQIALVAADISSRSLRSDNNKSESLYRHCHGLSNYQNPYDEKLSLAHSKQQALSERAGRTGLPRNERHRKSININCQEQFTVLDAKNSKDNPLSSGSFAHTWYLSNPVFIEDFITSISGNIDRNYIPTRRPMHGELCLFNPESIIFLED